MNSEIETLFAGFEVDGQAVPVKFLDYEGDSPVYITYNMQNAHPGVVADNALQASVQSYDFHIYSKVAYARIEEAALALLAGANWVWTGAQDMPFDQDAGWYHRINTLEKERSH